MSELDQLATQVAGVQSTKKYLDRGTNVGRYVVLDRLGEGGMGIVYRAFDPELDRMVALKLLHVRAKTGATIGDASWLLREAQALARLSHPNVVIVHDVGAIDADRVFVAMELVDGVTLRDWLRGHQRTWREVRNVMLAAGAGLAAAHAAKLVHRDVKPENILVGASTDPAGTGPERVRVMDFGLARLRRGTTAPIVHASDDEAANDAAPAVVGANDTLASSRGRSADVVGANDTLASSRDRSADVVGANDTLASSRGRSANDVDAANDALASARDRSADVVGANDALASSRDRSADVVGANDTLASALDRSADVVGANDALAGARDRSANDVDAANDTLATSRVRSANDIDAANDAVRPPNNTDAVGSADRGQSPNAVSTNDTVRSADVVVRSADVVVRPADDIVRSADDVEIPVMQKPLVADLTVIEGVIGTPAYMAPELFDGLPADTRSDQFSFGVVLWEALFGERPYAKVSLVPDKSTPKPEVPTHPKVPARISAIAQRAIAIDPAQRFASMDELIAALAVDPTARRRRIAMGVAAVAALALTIGATIAVTRSSTQVCKGIAKRLDGTWDAATKRAIRDAYVATKLPYAERAYDALEPALDRYANDWVAMTTDSCEATRVRRDQPEDVMALRDACLSRRLVELGALTRLLVDPTKSAVEKADQVAFELEPLTRCADVASLREPGVPSPEVAAKLAPVERKIADAKAQLIAGRYLSALTAATEASKSAEAIGWFGARAEAERTRGGCLLASGNNEDAVATITRAIWDAEVAKRDDLVAHDAFSLAMITAEALGKPSEAKVWLGLGAAAAKRSGIDDHFEVDRYKVEGLIEANLGNLPAAVAAQEKAFTTAEKVYRGGPVLAGDEALFAGTLVKAYEYEKAVPHFEHAIKLRSQIVGMEHPDIALMLSNLAVAYHHTRDPRARATFERALALREKLYGAQSPVLVPTLDNFAVYLRQERDPTGALALIERAERLAAIFPGKDNYAFHIVVTDRAEILLALGRTSDAHAAYNLALDLEASSHSTALPTTQSSRAELALVEGGWADAATFAQQAVAGFEAAGGADNPELWRPLTQLGRALVELGKLSEARTPLQRGIAIGTRIRLPAADLAPARAALARIAP